MLEKEVPCTICFSDDYTEMYPAGKAQIHRIVKCNVCGLMYANPQTDNVSGVEEIHLKSKEKSEEDELEKFTPENHQYLKKQFLQLRDYARIIDFVEEDEKGIFLEIGSYAGIFLNEAKKRGWQVLGIEPLEIPALYAERKLGIRVIREYFETADIPDDSINVISSCHVIEHVPDPGKFLNKAYSVLKKGGKMILETPTYDSLLFRILKHRERSIRCEGHLYFFTEKTLTNLVEKNGFKVLKHEKVGRTLTMERLFYNFGVITGKENLFSRLSQRFGFNEMVMHINTKDMQRIYCEKV